MSSRLASEILRFWNAAQKPARLGGLNASASAWLIAKLISESQSNITLICANSDSATKLYQDLKTFFTLLDLPVDQLDLFPGWEQSPYLAYTPSIKNRVRRLRTLHRLARGEIRCVVTDIEALSQKCPDASSIRERTFDLAAGDFISRDELISKLETAGYSRTDPVEDPGTYAIRGGLCDVFSPSVKRPVRIEFFGDEIESIRAFDPGTQKSDPMGIPRISVIPVTDFSFNEETAQRAQSSLHRSRRQNGVASRA